MDNPIAPPDDLLADAALVLALLSRAEEGLPRDWIAHRAMMEHTQLKRCLELLLRKKQVYRAPGPKYHPDERYYAGQPSDPRRALIQGS